MRTLTFIVTIVVVTAFSLRGYAQLETTVTAQGTGKIPATHCIADPTSPKPRTVCGVSGSGTNYGFKFSGPPTSKVVEGTVSIHDADFGVRIDSVAVLGTIDSTSNVVKWEGVCVVSDLLSQKVATVICSGSGVDQGEPGTEDLGEFSYGGFVKEAPASGKGLGNYMSGGVQID